MAAVEPALYQARRDRALRAQLAEDDGVKRALKRVDDETSGFGLYGRRRLLVGALRVTRTMAPAVADALDACRRTLGFTHPLELFIKPDATFGAFVLEAHAGPTTIGLTSSLVEAFSPAELRFVLGHELGHAVFEHMKLPMPLTASIEDMAGTLVSRATAIRLYLWCRSAEISADRAGLLCAGSLDAAASAFFKLSSGLRTASVGTDLQHYLSQVDAIASAPVGRRKPRDADDTLECFSTHPYAPLRMRALCAYARSDAYAQASAAAAAGHPALALADAEAIVERDLELMEPSYLEEKSDDAELLRSLLFLYGLCVAHADGEAKDSEVRALKALVGTDAFHRAPTASEAREDAAKKAITAREKTSPLQRMQLVQHLTIIAAADGSVHETEWAVMQAAAEALDVPHLVIEETLRAASHPLD